jgi:hypothetical protein
MFKSILEFFECIGRRRAATYLNRLGYHTLARDVMLRD